MPIDVYRKLVRAKLQGHGLRLSAQDVREIGDTEFVIMAARLRALQLCTKGRPRHRKGRGGMCECSRY